MYSSMFSIQRQSVYSFQRQTSQSNLTSNQCIQFHVKPLCLNHSENVLEIHIHYVYRLLVSVSPFNSSFSFPFSFGKSGLDNGSSFSVAFIGNFVIEFSS